MEIKATENVVAKSLDDSLPSGLLASHKGGSGDRAAPAEWGATRLIKVKKFRTIRPVARIC
jgi:hypothetical protein